MIHIDGRVHWVLEHKRAVFDDDGSLLWFDGVLLNISDRKQAEEHLRRSEAMDHVIAQEFPNLMLQLNCMEYLPNYILHEKSRENLHLIDQERHGETQPDQEK
jgi:PAS domain-containing protein